MEGQVAPTICLAMIVKNEAHIIARCLESVSPYIDSWLVCDTGSTDGTQDRIRKLLADIPGELVSDPWVDFGTNRTHSLELATARGCAYLLVIDADEVLRVEDPYALANLTADAYRITAHYVDGISWPRVNILRAALPWRYVGILHEYPECGEEVHEVLLPGVSIWTDGKGARGNDPDKLARDTATLEAAVSAEPDNSRYLYYLGQAYEVANRLNEAIDAYEIRTVKGGNPDEVWWARYRTAQLNARRGDWHKAIVRFLAAYQLDPSRAEPLYWLAQGYIDHKHDALAMLFLEQVALIHKPASALLVENSVYDYLRWLQYALTAHNLGRDADARDIAERLLASGRAPAEFHAQLHKLARTGEDVREFAESAG